MLYYILSKPLKKILHVCSHAGACTAAAYHACTGSSRQLQHAVCMCTVQSTPVPCSCAMQPRVYSGHVRQQENRLPEQSVTRRTHATSYSVCMLHTGCTPSNGMSTSCQMDKRRNHWNMVYKTGSMPVAPLCKPEQLPNLDDQCQPNTAPCIEQYTGTASGVR